LSQIKDVTFGAPHDLDQFQMAWKPISDGGIPVKRKRNEIEAVVKVTSGHQ
jgi:hypothetical protein